MGSLVKKVSKNVTKYNKALEIVQSRANSLEMPESFEQYDLAEAVNYEIEQQKEDSRKLRNKNKRIRRERRNK